MVPGDPSIISFEILVIRKGTLEPVGVFKNTGKSINLFFEHKLIATFVPIDEKETKVPPFYGLPPNHLPLNEALSSIPTKEITLVRIR